MNVLSKIVIPKTNVTSMYIISEMEEFAREEFFRLKKILEIKRKMYGGVEEKKKEPVMCTVCEPSTEWAVIGRCINCDALVLPVGGKTKEDEKLEEFKTHLSEILNVTRDLEERSAIAVSVDNFIKTVEQLKEKLEQKSKIEEEEPYDQALDKLCEDCKKKYLEEKAAAVEEVELVIETESEPKTKPEPPPIPEPKPKPEPPSTPEPKPAIKPATPQPSSYEPESNIELGIFETEVKEITKVIRVKREDGSIREEKKVIQVKKEVRTPFTKAIPPPNALNQERAGRITYQPSGASATSSKSNPYSGSRTVGVVNTKSLDYFHFIPLQRKVNSEILNQSSPMSNPVVRYCVSSITLLSIDFGEYSPITINSCIECDGYFNK